MRIPNRLTYITLFAVAVTFQAACRGSRGDNTGPLPSPSPDQMKLADYEPQKGFTQVSPGLAMRTVFVVEPTARDPYHVEVQDVIVAPGRDAVQIPLQGAATFEVRSGSGTVMIAGRSQDVGAGSSFSVSEGEPLMIAAKADGPITLRGYVVKVP